MVMSMYQKQQERKERLSGYRGIVLSTNIQNGQAIDVDKSDLGHESEIILPQGSYNVSVHRILKKYEDQLSDKDTTVDKVIQNTTSLEDTYKENSFYKYVMHHHTDDLSPKSRNHLFYLFKPNQGEPLSSHEISEDYFDGKIRVKIICKSQHLFNLYNAGIFKSAEQKRIIQQMAKQVLDDTLQIGLKYITYEKTITSPSFFLDLAKIINPQEVRRVYGLLSNKIRDEYHRLNGPEETKRLNSITDARERQTEMRKHIEKLKDLLQKLQNI